jgi:hypothetical protein
VRSVSAGAPRGGADFKGTSVRTVPWEGARPRIGAALGRRAARTPRWRTTSRRGEQLARNRFTVPLFEPSTTFTKAVWCFSPRVLHKLLPNFECHHIPVNRSCCRLTTCFTNFLSKFEMLIYRKVVSLEKLDNFHIGRF